MRTVWAQATRPKLSSCTAPRPGIKSIAARRTAAANASRSEVAACDIFAFFLGPVLAAAAFADVSWKERKRKEWEKRFAEINHQLESLRAREVEVWTRIQYHSVRHGILQHKRMYSTAAAATVREHQPALSDRVSVFFEPTPGEPDASWNPQPASTQLRESSRILSNSLGDLPNDSPLLRYERLLALRLALRMLLHVYTGSDDMHVGRVRAQRPDLSAEEIGRVVIRLRVVTDELDVADRRFSSKRRKKPFRHDSPESQSAEILWQTQIQELGTLYRHEHIDVAGLVNRLSQLLLRADQKPPGPEFYARVVMLLSVNNLPDLAKYAVSTLQNTTYVLTNHDICLMLNHSSVTRNYKAYDWVIHNLTDKKGVLATESNLWKWVRMSGMLLPLPKDEAPAVLRALIRAALNFNDPKPAEAYAQLPSLTRSSPTMGYAIKAFLQYYAKAADWTNGRRWLREAQKWLGTRKEAADPALRAVFVRVFDFLVAFRMNREFHNLLDTVVDAGIEPPVIDQRARESSERVWRIVERWREQINTQQPTVSRNLAAVRLAMRNMVESLPGSDVSPLHLRESSSTPNAQVEPGLKAAVPVDDRIANTAVLDVDTTPSSEVDLDPSVGRCTEPENRSDDEVPLEESSFPRADIDRIPELDGVQRQELTRTHTQQQEVIEEQGQKLNDLQNSMAALKALVELNVKAGQAADTTQHRQAQRLQDQETKIQALEDEVRLLRDQQELQATRVAAPPPYQEDDPISEQLRFYLTQAFSDPHDLTVPQVVTWAETASNVRCPKISKADAPTSQRRPMLYFIFKNVQSGRLSVDTLKAEAEAAQVRAERFLAEQEESRQARITAAETPADKPPTPAPSRGPEIANNPLFDSVGWNTGGLSGASTGSSKNRYYSTLTSLSQRPESKLHKRTGKLYKAASPGSGTSISSAMSESITCSREQRRCFTSGCRPHPRSRPVRRSESIRGISAQAVTVADVRDAPRTSTPTRRSKDAESKTQRSQKEKNRSELRRRPAPRQKGTPERIIRKIGLNFDDHFSLTKVKLGTKQLPIRKQILTWQLYRRIPVEDPSPPSPTTHDPSSIQSIPSPSPSTSRTPPVVPRPVPTNNPIPLVHRVFAPPPRRQANASRQQRRRQQPQQPQQPQPRPRTQTKSRPLRLRKKYPTSNLGENETYQPALHLRYVHARESVDSVRGGGVGGVDALGGWDSGVR